MSHITQLLEVVRAYREYVDALPKDLALPAMPGFDRDWADAIESQARAALAQPEPVEPKLSMFKLLAITTAYEQGVGKGKQGTEFNPYTEGTTEREAWRLGYQEGQGMAAKGGAL